MTRRSIAATLAAAAMVATPAAWAADVQYKLLVLAIPNNAIHGISRT